MFGNSFKNELKLSRAILRDLRSSWSALFVLIIHNIATCSNNEEPFNRFNYNHVAHETVICDVCIASCLRRLYSMTSLNARMDRQRRNRKQRTALFSSNTHATSG